MRRIRNVAIASILTLSLSACGGNTDNEDATTQEVETASAAIQEGEEGDVLAPLEEVVDGEEAEAESDAEEIAETEPVAIAADIPAGPPSAFTQCQVCHMVEPGQNGIGPSLAGVFGRGAASVADFSYTDAMRGSGLVWDEATLNRYLSDPIGTVPGTTMAVASMSDEDRQAIIDYLKTL